MVDYYEKDLRKITAKRHVAANKVNDKDIATNWGTRAGMEDAFRPKPIEIWRNR